MSDLEIFCETMNGDWEVIRYEMEGEKVRVHYQSQMNPLIVWSHIPMSFDMLPKIGTVGRIGFIARTP